MIFEVNIKSANTDNDLRFTTEITITQKMADLLQVDGRRNAK